MRVGRARLRPVLARVRRQLPARPVRGPLLSVVVPVYNVERYVEEALRSVLDQSYHSLQVIVVDDGSTDRSAGIVDRIAAADRRVKVIHQPNAGLGAARNTGIGVATGTYLTCVDSDDIVEPGSYARIIRVLERTGSDFAVSSYRLLRNGKINRPAAWIVGAHRVERLRTTLVAFPAIQVNAVAWSKIYRTSFFRTAVGGYPEDIAFEDQEPATLAYARARAFDVLAEPVVRWRSRDEMTSITQQSHDRRNLEDRVLVATRVLSLLDLNGHPAARRERALQYLANGNFTLHHIGDGDRAYWDAVARGVRIMTDVISRDELIDRLDVRDRVLHQLIMAERRDEAVAFIEAGGRNIANWVVRPGPDGLLYGELSTWSAPPEVIPAWAWRVTARQAPLQTFVEHWRWLDDGVILEVMAYAYFAGLDEDDRTITVSFTDPAAAVRLEAAVEPADSPIAGLLTKHHRHAYRHAGFVARLPAVALADARTATGRGKLSFTCDVQVRSAGAFATMKINNTWGPRDEVARELRVVADTTVLARYDKLRGLVVECRPRTQLQVESITVEGRSVHLAWRPEPGFTPAWVELLRRNDVATTWVQRADDHSATVLLPTPPERHLLTGTRIRLVAADGTQRTLLWDSSTSVEPGPMEEQSLTVARGNPSQPYFYETAHHGFLTDVRCGPHAVEIELDVSPANAATLSARLSGPRDTVVTGSVALTPRGATISFPTDVPGEPGWRSTALPSGIYTVTVGASSAPFKVQTTAALDARLPLIELGPSTVRVDVSRAPARGVRLELTSIGDRTFKHPRAQLTLVESYQSRPHRELSATMYLQCLNGDQVNDNQLAMARVLETTRPDIHIVWGVEDASVRVPLEHDSVVIGSAAYFDKLASAAVLCFSHEVPMYLSAQPGQLVVQTYHGHPFKMMGAARWRALGMTPMQIERALKWRRHWDLLLSPSPVATTLLRENFPVRAEIVEVGHPRNDRLVSASPAEREAIRRDLGVPDGAIAVLYAPTWRDYATRNPWASKMVTFVEPAALARELGPQYVVLLRGHPAHGRGGHTRVREPGVIDVTYHPDANDLIIASDVGVFDYSSIRFDYGVTGKPMVFFVPDLEQFFTAAPALLPYEQTAPGPLVSNAGELSTAIKDVVADLGPWLDSYRRFVATFAPHDDGHAAERFIADVLRRSSVLGCAGRGVTGRPTWVPSANNSKQRSLAGTSEHSVTLS
jgi:CDP-glycerol glycerophosphotransferase